ncbi:MAG TPA: TetR/AcrR family transcriptional regulator [Solirubrobacteraceae bacterium]|jgi:AcrR family transcriptional regulator|nr:TetR/AcrR family transcriptional regulator [Solirubrobacteraceae bacterium]
MPAQTQSNGPIEPTTQKSRKATQRERLVASMIAAGNDVGYARANVSTVIEQAGVSRPTFYDYFRDRDDCFLGALDDVYQRLLAHVSERVDKAPADRALHCAVEALIDFAAGEPDAARFLTSEAMTAGPRTLDTRDSGLEEIGLLVERRHASVAASTPLPDVSPRMLMGGVYRLIGARLRRGEPGLTRLREDLLVWVDSYKRPACEQRWSSLAGGPAYERSPFVPSMPLKPPDVLGPGRPRIPAAEVAENQRLRIFFATATLAAEKSYAASTVADILKFAGVDGRTFYAQFAGKQEAFMAVHEFGVQQVLWVTGQAFFSGSSWPERVWEAVRALTQFLEINPLIAQVGFIEAYAAGPAAVQRIEDSHLAFTMFLQEGYQHVPQSGLSRLALEAIVMTIFEIVYCGVRARGAADATSLLAPMSLLCLAPFLGAREAAQFMDSRSAEHA